MERLTEKRDGQNVIPLRQNGKVKWSICSAGLGDAPTKYLYGEHADRLAAYEDTGLEPCDYSAMDHALKQAARAREDLTEMIRQIGATGLDRLRELAQADREGLVHIIQGPDPGAAVCGNCGNFIRNPGKRTGVCTEQSCYRDHHGNEEPWRGTFSPSQSRKACRKFVRRGKDKP